MIDALTHAIRAPLTPCPTLSALIAYAKTRTPLQRAEVERNLLAECRERLNDEAPHDPDGRRVWRSDGPDLRDLIEGGQI